MIWLGIDTANSPLSIAIVKDGEILVEENSNLSVQHSLGAMPAIEQIFKKANLQPGDVDKIAVSKGPGSYTGVRIGVTIAKTLAWTLKKPLVGVSSLYALAANATLFDGLICPVVDARRKNVYAAAYRANGFNLQEVVADGHYSLDQFLSLIEEQKGPVLMIGKDAPLYETEIKEALLDRVQFAPFPFNMPRASSLIEAAVRMPEEEAHSFVPEYRRLAEAEANWLKEQKNGAN